MKNTYCIMYTYKKRMPVQYCALLYSVQYQHTYKFAYFFMFLYGIVQKVQYSHKGRHK